MDNSSDRDINGMEPFQKIFRTTTQKSKQKRIPKGRRLGVLVASYSFRSGADKYTAHTLSEPPDYLGINLLLPRSGVLICPLPDDDHIPLRYDQADVVVELRGEGGGHRGVLSFVDDPPVVAVDATAVDAFAVSAEEEQAVNRKISAGKRR